MMLMLARFKMYAYAAAAAIVAIGAVYLRGKQAGKHELEMDMKDKRLDDLITSKETRDEIEALDDDGLTERANKWVRGKDND